MSGGLAENQLGDSEIKEELLIDIKGYWDMSYEHRYNDRNMWEGQFILYADGWLEGIVIDPNSPYTKDRLIFGIYLPNKYIELLKATPSDVSDPFVFRCKRDTKGYEGKFAVIGLMGEEPLGVSHLITQVSEKQENIASLKARIKSFKENMDETLQSLYGSTLKMRSQMILIAKRNYEGQTFSEAEIAEIKKVTDPISEETIKRTAQHIGLILSKQKKKPATDDDLPF